MYQANVELRPNPDGVTALASRNQAVWERVERASFLTDDEKRIAVGYPPMNASGDQQQ